MEVKIYHKHDLMCRITRSEIREKQGKPMKKNGVKELEQVRR